MSKETTLFGRARLESSTRRGQAPAWDQTYSARPFQSQTFSATGITERSKCGQELAFGIGSRTPIPSGTSG